MPPIVPIAGMGMSALYNLYKDWSNSKKSEAERQKALAEIDKLQIPDTEKMKIANEMFQYGGDYTPESMGDTELGKITEDPRLRQSQISALQNLENIATQGGLTATDKLRLEEINQGAAQQERAQRGALMQNMSSRGLGGSGIELASQLQNIQGGASNRALQGQQVAAGAEQRALQAMLQAGQLGGQVRGQDYGISSNKAQAQDAINRFNAANRNQAQLRNLDTRQDINNQNVGLRNQQNIYNRGLSQQNFNNQKDIARMRTNAYSGEADRYDRRADRNNENFRDSLYGGSLLYDKYYGGK